MRYIKRADALRAVLRNTGDAAVAAVQMIPSPWISVKDRLPESGLRVLATDGSFVGESYISTAGNWYRYGTPWTLAWRDWTKDKTAVTHWMPLPDAPEVEG